MKRVILTGASGFVGANLTRTLLREGHDVHLLLREAGDHWRLRDIAGDVVTHFVDLADAAAVDAVVSRVHADWVFHLAAYGAYAFQTDARRMVDTNVLGTINLVEACARTGCDAFVNTGSSSEYGFTSRAAEETDLLVPNSSYAVTKAAATHYCHYVAQREGLHLITLRLYSIYGSFEDPGRLMPRLVAHGLLGKLPPLVNPEIARDFVYVTDASRAYLLAARSDRESRGEIYNIGTGIQTSLRELVELARAIFPISVEPTWGSMPDRQWDSSIWVANTSKAAHELGWRPTVDLKEGLERFAAWLQDDPAARGRYVPTPGVSQ